MMARLLDLVGVKRRDIEIPNRRSTYPPVIIWGPHVYVRTPKEDGNVRIYHEVRTYVVNETDTTRF